MTILLDPTWLFKYNTKNNKLSLDPEYTSLKIKAFEQKCLSDIENHKYEHIIEVLYHMINLNNFMSDKNTYNVFFKLNNIFQNTIIEMHEEILENGEYSTILGIANDTREIFINIIDKYLSDIISNNKLDIILKNIYIHNLSHFYVLFKNEQNEKSLYRIYKQKNTPFNVDIAHIADNVNIDYIASKDEIKDISLMGVEYDSDINSATNLILAITILNNIFNKNQKINIKIFVSLMEHLKQNKTLKFKFIP